MFRCSACNSATQKWSGRCLNCGEWSTLIEAPDEPKKKKGGQPTGAGAALTTPLSSFAHTATDARRLHSGWRELDNLLGGGLVPGSLILLAGEPGIGKSTLVAHILLAQTENTVYISGEESGEQVALRFQRLEKNSGAKISFVSSTDCAAICDLITKTKPRLVVVDSVQTIRHSEVMGEAGGVAHIRAITNSLLETANATGTTIILIGHVTKDGSIAGPKTLEHLVDVVVAIEGERSEKIRFVRCFKNRFGPTDEVVVFEMTGAGLKTVADPSGLLLSERSLPVPGSVVTCLMDGNRPFLVEIQALTSKTAFGMPARRANGFDASRLQMLLAVLGRRMGLPVDTHDVFVNIVGGLTANEPAVDVAVCMAIASALADKTIPQTVVAFGEVGLSGEIRRVNNMDKRLREAEARGFKFAIIPKTAELPKLTSLKCTPLTDIRALLEKFEK